MGPNLDPKVLKGLSEVLKRNESSLRKKANVEAVGVGFKEIKGKRTKNLSLIVSVSRKCLKTELFKGDLVPDFLEGYRTDVVQTGKIIARADPRKDRVRPAPPGVSVGHPQITAGTLGWWIKRAEVWYMVSNCHVLANSGDAKKGDPIYQPGPYDLPICPENQIARLDRFVPIKFLGNSDCSISKAVTSFLNFGAQIGGRKTRFITEKQVTNEVDAAVAELDNLADMKYEILEIGAPVGIAEPTLGELVVKSGRTTGVTEGIITQINVTVNVSYGGGRTAVFIDQVISDIRSDGGDSGSVVLDKSGLEIVGLLFAGGEGITVMNKAASVLDELF